MGKSGRFKLLEISLHCLLSIEITVVVILAYFRSILLFVCLFL